MIDMKTEKLSVRGSIEDVPINSVILGDVAFDMDFLNNNGSAQSKLIDWVNADKMVYIKINQDTMIDSSGIRVGINFLPNRLIYHNLFGVMSIFER